MWVLLWFVYVFVIVGAMAALIPVDPDAVDFFRILITIVSGVGLVLILVGCLSKEIAAYMIGVLMAVPNVSYLLAYGIRTRWQAYYEATTGQRVQHNENWVRGVGSYFDMDLQPASDDDGYNFRINMLTAPNMARDIARRIWLSMDGTKETISNWPPRDR